MKPRKAKSTLIYLLLLTISLISNNCYYKPVPKKQFRAFDDSFLPADQRSSNKSKLIKNELISLLITDKYVNLRFISIDHKKPPGRIGEYYFKRWEVAFLPGTHTVEMQIQFSLGSDGYTYSYLKSDYPQSMSFYAEKGHIYELNIVFGRMFDRDTWRPEINDITDKYYNR